MSSFCLGCGNSMAEGEQLCRACGRDAQAGAATPVPDPAMKITETIYVDWRFNDPPVSVLPTLEALVRLVRAAVKDVRREASL